MSVNALSNRSLGAIGGVGAFAAVVGGAAYFKAAGIVAAVGGIVAAAGVITALAVVVFAAYKHYYPPITSQAPSSSLPSPAFITPQAPNLPAQLLALDPAVVSQVARTRVLVQCILKFLPDEEILSAERVSKSWKRWASDNAVWKYLCDREGIPPIKRPSIDPKKNQPIDLLFFKAAYQHLYPIIFGPRQYADLLKVKVHGSVVPLNEGIHEVIDGLEQAFSALDPQPQSAPSTSFSNMKTQKAALQSVSDTLNAKALASQSKFRILYLPREIERLNSDRSKSVASMTINLLRELVRAPGVQNPPQDHFWLPIIEQHGEKVLDHSNWVLLTVDVIQGTRNAAYLNQINNVTAVGGRVLKLIEAIALNFFDYVRFKTYPYGENPCTRSRVDATVFSPSGIEYRVVVGGFGSFCYSVDGNEINGEDDGMAAAYSCGNSTMVKNQNSYNK